MQIKWLHLCCGVSCKPVYNYNGFLSATDVSLPLLRTTLILFTASSAMVYMQCTTNRAKNVSALWSNFELVYRALKNNGINFYSGKKTFIHVHVGMPVYTPN